MLEISLEEVTNIEIASFDGLLVDYVVKRKANAILRGMRAVSDFEYEFQMTFMNRKLKRNIETIFMMTGLKWFYVNSRIIKEAAIAGGSVKGLVPDIVCERLEAKLKEKNLLRI